MKKTILITLGLFTLTLFGAGQTLRMGECPGTRNENLPVNNQQALDWKKTTKNLFTTRSHIQGTIDDLYADRNGHVHFSILIGRNENDTIEIVYNEDFGKLPDNLKRGMKVISCGDFITSYAATDKYPASPDGAILHWVHMNPRPTGHPAGYLAIDGKLYGQTYQE